MSGSGARNQREGGGLGTFGGVFTPSVLTILGIILFLRHGWVVGSAGLSRALLLIFLAHAVSVLTSLSLAAIATNRRVRGGGDYFLISRSLGPEFGGALGVVLFLAQSVSIAFYCFGFGEALAPMFGELAPNASSRHIAAGAAVFLLVIAYVGADLATRFQFLIMFVMGAALLSFFIGAAGRAEVELLSNNWAPPEASVSFWALFAIFFPAVTGFTQGVSMSGDLEDPSRSLPSGTFAAVSVSLLVYTAAALLFAAGAPAAELAADYQAFRDFSFVPVLFDAGVIAATLSSALASALGAPRILQAMARDQIFPLLRPFAAGTEGRDNPRRAVLLAALIALAVLAAGNLNAVASLISMFFLISYGLLNYATYFEAHGASPAFRPRFRFFDKRLSLLGAALCAISMLAIDPWAGASAIVVMTTLYFYLRSRDLPVGWVDSRPAHNFRKLKQTVREIDRLPNHDWGWQPNILIFGENAERRDLLTRFGVALSGTSGLATSVGVVRGEGDFETSREACEALAGELREEIESQGLDAFPLTLAAPDLRVAVSTLLQTWGIGPVRANTVLLDWWEHLPRDAEGANPLRYGRQLRSVLRLGCHVLIFDVTGREFRAVESLASEERRIDVWWWEDSSCRLSLLLAYLMTRSENWEDATIRVLAPCSPDQDEKTQRSLQVVLDEARIDASIVMVPDADSANLIEYSKDSSLVFFRMGLEGMKVVGPFGGPLEMILSELPIACVVGAARSVGLHEKESVPLEKKGEAEAEGKENESKTNPADVCEG